MFNFYKYYLRNALIGTSVIFCGGSILQTFMAALGITPASVSAFIIISNVINIAVGIIFANVSDKYHNTKRIISYTILGYLFIVIGLLLLCFIKVSPLTAVIIITAFNGLFSFSLSLRAIFEFKLPYKIIDIRNLHILSSVDGFITSVLGIIASLIFAFFVARYEFFNVLAVALVISAIMIIGGSIVNESFEISKYHEEKEEKTLLNIFDLLKIREFKQLIFPNMLRGMINGVLTMSTTIGFTLGILNEKSAAYLVTAITAATVLSSLCYAFLAKRYLQNYTLLFIGTVLMSLMVLFYVPNGIFFIAVNFICYFGMCMVNYAVPLTVYEFVPYEISGVYHAWRLLLTTTGFIISTAVIGIVLEKNAVIIPFIKVNIVLFMLFIAMILAITAGIIYYHLNKKFILQTSKPDIGN